MAVKNDKQYYVIAYSRIEEDDLPEPDVIAAGVLQVATDKDQGIDGDFVQGVLEAKDNHTCQGEASTGGCTATHAYAESRVRARLSQGEKAHVTWRDFHAVAGRGDVRPGEPLEFDHKDKAVRVELYEVGNKTNKKKGVLSLADVQKLQKKLAAQIETSKARVKVRKKIIDASTSLTKSVEQAKGRINDFQDKVGVDGLGQHHFDSLTNFLDDIELTLSDERRQALKKLSSETKDDILSLLNNTTSNLFDQLAQYEQDFGSYRKQVQNIENQYMSMADDAAGHVSWLGRRLKELKKEFSAIDGSVNPDFGSAEQMVEQVKIAHKKFKKAVKVFEKRKDNIESLMETHQTVMSIYEECSQLLEKAERFENDAAHQFRKQLSDLRSFLALREHAVFEKAMLGPGMPLSRLQKTASNIEDVAAALPLVDDGDYRDVTKKAILEKSASLFDEYLGAVKDVSQDADHFEDHYTRQFPKVFVTSTRRTDAGGLEAQIYLQGNGQQKVEVYFKPEQDDTWRRIEVEQHDLIELTYDVSQNSEWRIAFMDTADGQPVSTRFKMSGLAASDHPAFCRHLPYAAYELIDDVTGTDKTIELEEDAYIVRSMNNGS